VQHACIVRDLAERQQQKAHVHALHDGAQPSHGCADAHALRTASRMSKRAKAFCALSRRAHQEAVLADRRVQQTELAVLLVQVVRDLRWSSALRAVTDQHAA
jgi:hypothetical protein